MCGAGLTLAFAGCGGSSGDAPAPPPPPNPLYVRAQEGRDTNSGGSPATALRSIAKAASLARTGYRIIVGQGVYVGGVTTAAVGEAPQRLQFIADVDGSETGDPPGAVVVSRSGTTDPAGFNLFNSADSVIDGFTITGFPDAGIVIKSGSDNFTIQNCIVFANPGDGIRVQDSASVLIFNNLIYGNGQTGIAIVGQLAGSPNARILSNTLTTNGNRGLTVGNTVRASPNAEVRNNIIQGNQGDANVKVFETPRSDLGYAGDYNLVFPATYIPVSIRGANDINANALFTSDFHVQPGSPTIDNGGPLNVPNSQASLLRQRTTISTNVLDSGVLDMGFHFIRNR